MRGRWSSATVPLLFCPTDLDYIMFHNPIEVVMAAKQKLDRRRFAPRLWRWSAFAGALASGYWLVAPSYIEVEFPIAPPPVGYFWYTTTYSTETMADMLGALHVRRQHQSGIFPEGLQTREETLRWFADQLRQKGWVPADPERFQRDPPVPELQFLKEGDEYFTYYRPEAYTGYNGNLQGANASVTVAVWQDRKSDTNNILVVTAKASFMRALFEATDD